MNRKHEYQRTSFWVLTAMVTHLALATGLVFAQGTSMPGTLPRCGLGPGGPGPTWRRDKVEKFVRDSPQQRAEWFMSRRRVRRPIGTGFRAASSQQTPAQKLRKAFEQLRTAGAFAAAAHDRSTGAWIELGPRPEQNSSWGDVGGRVTSLAYDRVRDELYVGTAFGGVWKMSNPLSLKSKFVPLGDDWLSLSVGSVTLSNENPPTVYVGTGEANDALDSYYGVGIMHSTASGWSDPVDTADVAPGSQGHYFGASAISKILIDPSDKGLLFAGVTAATGADAKNPIYGIYQSTDGGAKWSLMLGGQISDLVYDETSQTYYAAVVGRGILKYKLGGQWVQTASPFQCGISLSESNFYRVTLAARGGTVWALISTKRGDPSQPFPSDTGLVQTVDAGQTWTPIAIPDGLFQGQWGQGFYDQVLAAPADSQTLIVGGIDLWYTRKIEGIYTYWTDATNSYNNGPVHPDQHAIVALDSRTWFLGNDGGVWATTNAGGTWSNLNASLGAIQFMSVTPTLSVGSYVGGSQDNGTAEITTRGGLSWEAVFGGDGGFTSVDAQNPEQRFTEQDGISLLRSDYPGSDWYTVVDSRTIDEQGAFYTPYQLIPTREPGKSAVLLGTNRVWRGPSTPECPGAGWKPISDSLTDGFITSIAISPSNPDFAYAVTSDSLVYVTQNARDDNPTWLDITSQDPPVLPSGNVFTSATVHPTDPNIVFVGVAGFDASHVFKGVGANGTWNWTDVSKTLGDIPVNAIVVDPATPNDVYLATDLGVFFATDGGTPNSRWKRYGVGLPDSAILGLKLTGVGDSMLVAASHGRGAWKVPVFHPSPDFSLVMNPGVQNGRTGDPIKPFTVLVASADGYTGSVKLTCSAGSSGCSVSPEQIAAGRSATINVSGNFASSPMVVSVVGSDGKHQHFQHAIATVPQY